MVYLEIENTETGALLRIPGTFMYIKESFERSEGGPVSNVSWEEYTRSVQDTLDNIDDWNGDPHCLFGSWETISQSRNWRQAIDSVLQEDRNNYTSQDQIIIRTLKS